MDKTVQIGAETWDSATWITDSHAQLLYFMLLCSFSTIPATELLLYSLIIDWICQNVIKGVKQP